LYRYEPTRAVHYESVRISIAAALLSAAGWLGIVRRSSG
jgi:hypothetical protein